MLLADAMVEVAAVVSWSVSVAQHVAVAAVVLQVQVLLLRQPLEQLPARLLLD